MHVCACVYVQPLSLTSRGKLVSLLTVHLGAEVSCARHRFLPAVASLSSSHLAERRCVCMLCSWSSSCLLEALGQACEDFPAVPVHRLG